MEATTPLNTGLIEDEGTLESRGESLVTDDRRIYDELIAPLETRMMRSIWRIVRNADLAFRPLLETHGNTAKPIIGTERRAKRNTNINRARGLEVWDCAWVCYFPIRSGLDAPLTQSLAGVDRL